MEASVVGYASVRQIARAGHGNSTMSLFTFAYSRRIIENLALYYASLAIILDLGKVTCSKPSYVCYATV